MSRIFLSHSSRNSSEALAIRDWLASEGWDDVFLDLDPERGITAGERWERALTREANRCEAVLFLVSKQWLASEWCLREFHLASKMSKQVFPLLIDDIPIKKLPADLTRNVQIVNLAAGDDHKPFRAKHPETGQEAHVTFSQNGLKRLKAGLQKAGLDPRFFTWPPADDPYRQPWRGLKPMEAADAGIFYGREGPVIEALDRMRGLSDGAPPRLFVILSASGSGKSSFLRAGLWPRLARDDRRYGTLPVIRPSQGVLTGEAGLIRVLEEALREANTKINRAAIREAVLSGADVVADLFLKILSAGAHGDDPQGRCLLIAIDQAEELFQPAGRTEAAQFIALLANLARRESPRIMLVFTVRSDAYEPLQTEKAFEGLQQTLYNLPPMPAGAWGGVIEGPAQRLSKAGRKLVIEPQLTARLLADLEAGGGKDSLPLLSFTLERLYGDFGADGDLKLSEYEEFGGIAGAIDAAVIGALDRAAADPRLPPDAEARRMLLRRALIPWLAGIDPQTGQPYRMAARFSDIPEESRVLVEHLVEARLLSADMDAATGERMVEPAHEALLRQWGLLKGWLAEDFASLTTLEAVRRATRDWLANGRKPEYLNHRAGRLEDAEALHQRPDLAARLGADDRAYLAACRGAENAERQRQRRATRRLQRAFGIASLLAVLAGLAAWYGFDRAGEATRQASIAAFNEQVAKDQIKIAEEERKKAETQRAETVVAGKRTETLLNVPKAYFMLQDTPREALALVRNSTAELQAMDGTGSESSYAQFMGFYLDRIVNEARELPLNDFYREYPFGTLSFVVPQPSDLTEELQAGQAGATAYPLSLVGSQNTVGVIDNNGRPAGPPIGSLDLRLLANDAAWISGSSFVLATGGWEEATEGEVGTGKTIARNAELRIYDLTGKASKSLVDGHDAPFVSVAVTKAADGRVMILGGDALGRIVVVPSQDGEPQVILTGVNLPILNIFPNMVYGQAAVVFGSKPEGPAAPESDRTADRNTSANNLKSAGQILGKALGSTGADGTVWVGTESGAACASKFGEDSLVLCTTHGTVQLWDSYALSKLADETSEPNERMPTLEFLPFQSAPTEILLIPGTSILAIAATDGSLGLFSSDGQQITAFQTSISRSDSGIGKLGYVGGKRVIFGVPQSSSLRSWDVSDIVDQVRKPPSIHQQMDQELRQLSEKSWLHGGDFSLPKIAAAIPEFLKGTDRPEFEQMSNDRRFLMGLNDQMLLVADQAAGAIKKMDLPYDSSAYDKVSGGINWSDNRAHSKITDGHICILESVEYFDSSKDLPARLFGRVTLVDLVNQKIILQTLLRETSPVTLLGLMFSGSEPVCIYVSGTAIKLLGRGTQTDIPVDPGQIGMTADFSIDGGLLAEQARALFIVLKPLPNVHRLLPKGQDMLVRFNLATRPTHIVLGKFDTAPRLLDVTSNGRRLLIASGAKSPDDHEDKIDNIRLVDDKLNTINTFDTLPRHLNSAAEFHLSNDGLVLRGTIEGEFHEIPLDLGHLLDTTDRRLRDWETSEKLKLWQEKSRNCNASAQWDQCREMLKMATQEFPDDPDLSLLSGNATGEAESKITYYDLSLKHDPFQYIARYNKSEVLWRLGRYEDALHEYTQILSLPENIPAFEGGGSWGVADPIVNAVQNATRQIINAKRANLILHRARAYASLGRWQEALQDVMTIRGMGRESAESKQIEGEALEGLGQYDASIKAMSESLQSFRATPDQGWLHLPEGTVEHLSWRKFKEADILARLAQTHDKIGQRTEASKAFGLARELVASVLASNDRTEPISQFAKDLQDLLNGTNRE